MKINEPQLKELLVGSNFIVEEQFREAQQSVKKEGQSVEEVIVDLGFITDRQLGQLLANHFKFNYVDLRKVDIQEEVLYLIPELVARSKGVIAFGRDENIVNLGMIDPDDLEIIHLVEKKTGQKVQPHFITKKNLTEALGRYRASLKEEFERILEELKDKSKTREEQDEIIVKIVDLLLDYGQENKSSDIHLEPHSKNIVVRFRIDGIMHDVLEIPKQLSDLMLSRIKILAKMRTDVHRAAMDGKLRHKTDEETIDVRVSIVPVTQGENVVMRLLSVKSRKFNLSDLGFSGNDLKKVKRTIKNPHGMILVTGPTGSGKTTTLYAVLKLLNQREVHISTIEDPVEYDIEGVSQIQVNPKTNLTFSKGLRAIVRQDPDIIMVGEIRDEETAGIAVNAALTGHLVLSTLHTNDSATALPRLLDMGVEPFLVGSTVNIVIAQRLVRKICEKCRASYMLTSGERKLIELAPAIYDACKLKGSADLTNIRLYKGNGCKVCANTGYSGRVGVFEVLQMTEAVKELIMKHATSSEIKKYALGEGMVTMLEDGIEKVIQGVTTLSEVLRVAKK